MASYLLMMQPRLADRAALTWLAVALVVVYGVCAALARSLAQLQAPSLVAAAIAIDLTLTAGALIWWLGVRRAGLPSIVVPIAVALGAAIATRIPYAPTCRSWAWPTRTRGPPSPCPTTCSTPAP